MAVTALSARTGRHGTGSGRVATIRRVAAPAAPPPTALTITLNIPLTGDTLPPQAHRLIEAVRELVEAGQGSIAVDSPPTPAAPAQERAEGTIEVRLLTASRQVMLDGRLLPLTRLEFDLLLHLCEHPDRVHRRRELLAAVWGIEDDYSCARTVDVHIRRVRQKLGEAADVITTVRGVGYSVASGGRVRVERSPDVLHLVG